MSEEIENNGSNEGQNAELEALAGAAAQADAMSAEAVAPVKMPENPAPEIPAGSQDEPAPVPVLEITAAQIGQAMPEAAMIAGVVAGFVEKRFDAEIDDRTRDTAAEKIAPLLVKYDAQSPFLSKWRLEIDAAVFFGATAYGIWEAKRRAKKADAQALQAAPQGGE